jgi:tRNA-binding EMAP/Myf-like protein
VPTANENRPVNYAATVVSNIKKLKNIRIQRGRDENINIVFGADNNYAKHCVVRRLFLFYVIAKLIWVMIK